MCELAVNCKKTHHTPLITHYSARAQTQNTEVEFESYSGWEGIEDEESALESNIAKQ